MQPNMVVRIQDTAFQGVSPLCRGILKKRNNRETIHFNGEYGSINLLYRSVHAANQLCIYGAISEWYGPNSGDASQSGPESVRKMSPEIQIKQEDLKSLVDVPRLPHASGNRMLQNLNNFDSMPFMSKIEYLCTTAKSYHPIEKRNYCYNYSWRWRMEKAHFDVQRKYSAQKPRRIKTIRTDWCRKRNWSSLFFEIATVVDVLGIEVQGPSLSSLWILIVVVAKDLWMKFTVTTTTLWTTVPRCVRRKKTSMVCVSNLPNLPWSITGKTHKIRTMSEKKVEPSSIRRETVASTIRVAPASSNSSSGGSSNPTSIHLKAKSIYVKKEIPNEDRIWTFIPGCQKCKKRILPKLASRRGGLAPLPSSWKHQDKGLQSVKMKVEN